MWTSLKFDSSKVYARYRNAGTASSRLDREISVRTVTVTACCRHNDGMLKAILNAMVSMVSKLPAKASRALYKERRGFREGR